MDFKNNNMALDALMTQFAAFVGTDNPNSRFSAMRTPIEQYLQSPQLTKQALGDDALDEVAGIVAGDEGSGVISLFTGNAPGSLDRAAFLADLLSNFTTFHSWMKAYLDVRETGYMVVKSEVADEYMAIGPNFVSVTESPYVVHADPAMALALLHEKMGADA